jgi:nucleotide-binding universal stress UspA family protein
VSGVRRVIVGVSGSPGSLPALRYAERVAQRDDVPLVAVHAWIPPGGDLAERYRPSLHLRRIWQETAAQQLRDAFGAAWGCIPAGLDLQSVVIRGEAGPALIDTASFADDLLIVGAGRHGRLARLRHGGVTRYCVAHAVCPVYTVPPPAPTGKAMRGLPTLDQAVRQWDGGRLGRA